MTALTNSTKPPAPSDTAEQLKLNEARITELETRTAFQEDLLNTLNDVIARQDRTLATLVRKLDALHEQLRAQAEHGGGGGTDSSTHEPPPHY